MLALPYMCLQGTSVASERVFSTAGDILSKKRTGFNQAHWIWSWCKTKTITLMRNNRSCFAHSSPLILLGSCAETSLYTTFELFWRSFLCLRFSFSVAFQFSTMEKVFWFVFFFLLESLKRLMTKQQLHRWYLNMKSVWWIESSQIGHFLMMIMHSSYSGGEGGYLLSLVYSEWLL